MRANWFSSALERRNFRMLSFDGVLYNIALTFLDATILIPLFLTELGGSPLWIGLATAIRQVGFILPQLLIARWLPRIPRLTRFVFGTYLLCRFAFLLVILAMVNRMSPEIVMLAFFLGYTMFSLGEGIIQVPWMDVFGRTISPHNHGRLFGLMQTFGGIGAFLCGLVIQHVLAHPQQFPYPGNFIVIFSLAFVLLFVSTLSFLYVKEGPRRRIEPKENGSGWLGRGHLLRTWRHNTAFRRLLIVQTLLGLHQTAMPFYILYVQRLPAFAKASVGDLVLAQVIGGIAGGLLLGSMSARLGNRATISLTVMISACVPGLILLAGQLGAGPHAIDVQYWVWLGFFLLGVAGAGWIGCTNYLLEISNDETRGRFVAYLNTCSAPLAILPIFSASMIDRISYEAVFLIVLLLLLVALCWSFRLPKSGRRRSRDFVSWSA
ncbi:MFS transporter [Tumebacillus sp. DT12]|uniref:MFS transporter n=1 Tax=Tumebacillus lacus TaxID=2995335 RepID=A0ABT3X3G2_9BACL|nr:MFS transporter [Tumebacillus lacus]MCX7571423.1 MFS transporter [Tumebacillus lacus]